MVESPRTIEALVLVELSHAGGAWADRWLRDLLLAHGGQEVEKCERLLALFERPAAAVTFALAVQRKAMDDAFGEPFSARTAIHLAEVLLDANPPAHRDNGAKPMEARGDGLRVLRRLHSLVRWQQVLLTRAARDIAQRALVGEAAEELLWLDHGRWCFPSDALELEVFEVGERSIAAFAPPAPRAPELAERADGTSAWSWRPAAGAPLPQRPQWRMTEPLDEAATSWRVTHAKTGETRRFDFALTPGDFNRMARQIAAHRYMVDVLGRSAGLEAPLDWDFDRPPFHIERADSDRLLPLADWLASGPPFAVRAKAADALLGAVQILHGAGLVHGALGQDAVAMRSSGEPSLVHLGLAIARDGTVAAHLHRLSDPGRLPVGTEQLHYDPERARADDLAQAAGLVLALLLGEMTERRGLHRLPSGPLRDRLTDLLLAPHEADLSDLRRELVRAETGIPDPSAAHRPVDPAPVSAGSGRDGRDSGRSVVTGVPLVVGAASAALGFLVGWGARQLLG